MQQVSKAIIARYNAVAALKAVLTGGLYDTEAPQGTAYPYGVFQLISQTDEHTFSDVKENCIVQFKIYSNISGSSVAIDLILKQVLAAFNYCTLTVDDYTFLKMQKENIIKNKIDGIWEYLILFRIILAVDRT